MTVWVRRTTSDREHQVVGGLRFGDVQGAIGGTGPWQTVPVQLERVVVEVNPAHIVYVFGGRR